MQLNDISEYLDTLRPFGEGPFEWRNGQKETIIGLLEALDNWNNGVEGARQVAELSAPTSAGKSVILWAFSKTAIHFGMLKRSVITTPQKMLINQYLSEKGWFDGVVLGRGNYVCELDPSLMADSCTCRSPSAKKKHPQCNNCQYEIEKARFKAAKIGLTTMAYYLVGYAPQEPDNECLIIDESSNLEGSLLDRFVLKIPDSNAVPDLGEYFEERAAYDKVKGKNINKLFFNFDPNSKEGKDKLRSLITDYVMILTPEIEDLQGLLEALGGSGNTGKIKEVTKELNFKERELYKCKNILRYMAASEPFYVNEDRQFKLIFGKKLFGKLLNGVKFVILASGTPTTHLLTKDFVRVEMEHPIEVDRRQFIISGVGQMGLKSRDRTIPKVAKEIASLHELHADKKHTIVHCHSYEIAKSVFYELKRCTKAKIVLQESSNTKELDIAKWSKQKNSIFLSVKCNEGLNLKGPEFPLNIVIKVPFAYLGDGWVKARNSLDNDEYTTTEAAVAIMQAAGRTTRDPKDFSVTYCLDSDISWWIRKNERYLEPWFIESIARA